MGDLKTAYMAGLFDGEGSFSIQVDVRKSSSGRENVRFNPRMTMTLKYGHKVLDDFVDRYGGKVYHYDNDDHRWVISKINNLQYAANDLYPYLSIKKVICERFLEALGEFPANRANHAAGERSWTDQTVSRVANIAFTLNPSTARKSSKTVEHVKELIKIYDET